MSWRAMEAVQDYSRYQSAREHSAFRVMLAMASYADEHGVVGREGDYRSCPSYTTLAERAHLHRNTVANLIPRLVEDGELAVVAQGGDGRGAWAVYQIMLPMDVPLGAETSQGSREIEAEMLVTFVGEMSQGMRQMAEEIAQLRQLIAQGNVTNDTTVQRDTVHDPIMDPVDPDRDPGDPGARRDGVRVLHEGALKAPAPPFPADPAGLGKGGGQDARAPNRRDLLRPVLDGVGRRRAAVQGTAKAIAEVCGLDMRVRSHRKRCEEAAVQLTGYPEEYILARYGPPDGAAEGWNWYLHDWRGRKGEQPEPRLVVETIGKVWVGEGVGQGGLEARGPMAMSNNETTARRYAELRRKMMED
jgi:hypothetical protein